MPLPRARIKPNSRHLVQILPSNRVWSTERWVSKGTTKRYSVKILAGKWIAAVESWISERAAEGDSVEVAGC